MSDCFDDWNVAKIPTWAGRCREVGAWMAPTVVLALILVRPIALDTKLVLSSLVPDLDQGVRLRTLHDLEEPASGSPRRDSNPCFQIEQTSPLISPALPPLVCPACARMRPDTPGGSPWRDPLSVLADGARSCAARPTAHGS
jgi:hypothetical protein